ncbi:MAG: hypothetical protein U0169_18480 [Polyangiaceae bacterium]
MTPRRRADGIARSLRSIAEPALRKSSFLTMLASVPAEVLAPALDVLAARAEQAEAEAREALVAIVDGLNAEGAEERVQRLREESVGAGLLALERLLRLPTEPAVEPGKEDDITKDPPDYGHGRKLTLGERKSLARRPDRTMMMRLLADPHPDVIRFLLANPRITEDDVLRIAAKRPGRRATLVEIARSPRWSHSARIRLALVLNPETPPELAAPLVGLLVRQELRLVAEASPVSASIRALCLEHLERRPPGDGPPEDEPRLH